MAGCRGILLRALFFALFCYVPARAEFPPDTFPDDPQQENSQSYEESESQAADEEYLNPKKRRVPPKPKKKPRRDGVMRQPIPEDPPEEEAFRSAFRVGAYGGWSSLSSGSASIEGLLAQIYLKDHMAFGAMLDYQFTRHLGVEAEGYYAFTPLQEVEFPGGAVETRKMSSLTVMGGGTVGYPFRKSMVLLTPRLGVGFGYLTHAQFSGGNAAGDGTQTISVSGFYLSLGLEAQFGPKLVAFLDYALSVGAKGSFVGSGVGGTAANGTINAPSYDRLRIGATFKIWESIAVGPLVVLRSTKANVATDANRLLGQGERTFQVMALATLTL